MADVRYTQKSCAMLYTGNSKPDYDAEVLEFFAGKGNQETHDYIEICRRIEKLQTTEQRV